MSPNVGLPPTGGRAATADDAGLVALLLVPERAIEIESEWARP